MDSFHSFPEYFNASEIKKSLNVNQNLADLRRFIMNEFMKRYRMRKYDGYGYPIDIPQKFNITLKDISIIHNELIERGFTLEYGLFAKTNGNFKIKKYVEFTKINPYKFKLPIRIMIKLD